MKSRLREFLLNPFTLFLTGWCCLNLLQARLTPLNNDEAYYWMYSKYLAWGYFDHPPMIALMIRAGYYLIHNELGVRLVIVISQLLAFKIIWELTNKEQNHEKAGILCFFMIIVLMPIFNIYGFLATPDAPLILFTAVFLFAYKQFLKEENWQNTLFLSLSFAALMYSKYHGGLLIIMVLLSNPSLFKSPRFYIASAAALLLFFPHIYWQFSNGFPSVRYHLIDRVSTFNPHHVPDYIVGQYFYQNPLIFTMLIWIMIKVKTKDLFERAQYFIITGFFVFFLIASFRYRVEPQWLALVSVPIAIVLFNNLDFRPWLKGYLKWVTIFIFPAILFIRAASAIDFLHIPLLKREFHDKKQWVADIKKVAADRPVVFTNSYQRAAIYTFYSGNLAHTLDNLAYRKTQYDLWHYEEKVHGREVLYVPHFYDSLYKKNLMKLILTNGDSIFVRTFSNFQSLQRECAIFCSDKYSFITGMNSIHLKLFNPYPYTIEFRHKELPVVLQLAFLKKDYMEIKKNLIIPENLVRLNPGDTIQADFKFNLEDLSPGRYNIRVCSETGILYDTYNSEIAEAKVSVKN